MDHSTTLNSKLVDLESSIKRVEDFQKNRMKQLGPTQIKIIMLKMAEELKNHINSLVNSPDLTIEERIEGFTEYIPRMRTLLNRIPGDKELKLVSMKFNTMNNLLITAFSQQQLSDDTNVEIHSKATLIAKMLVGVPKIQYEPTRVPPNPSNKELEIRRTYFNSIQMTSALYLSALTNTHLIDNDDLKRWIEQIFHHFDLYIQFIEKLDVKYLWQQTSNDYEKFYFRIWASLLPATQITSILTIYEILGDNWSIKLEQNYLLQEPNLDGFLQLIKRVKAMVNDQIEEIDNYYMNGLIDKNAKPMNFKYYKFINVIESLLEFQEMLINVLSENMNAVDLARRLTPVLNKIEILIDTFVELSGGQESIKNSTFTGTVIGLSKRYIQLLMLYSLNSKEISHYNNRIQNIDFLFETQQRDQIPVLSFLKEITSLNLLIELNKDINYSATLDRLREILSGFQSEPQFALATEIIISILSHICKQESDSYLIDDLDRIYNEYITGMGLLHLDEEFEQYKNYLAKTYRTKTNQPLPIMRRERNILDPWTWILPDFTKLVENEYQLIYLPFNRQRDRIIDLQ